MDKVRRSDEAGAQRSDPRFPDTRWSLISHVKSGETEERDRALSELCRIYWFPLYAFARGKGCDPRLSEDLTQDLFARLLSNNSFEAARKDRGRLRNYLLTAMNRTMANDARKRSALKRAPEGCMISIERDRAEEWLAPGPGAGGFSPEEEFDRRWAQALLQEVESRLKSEYENSGNGPLFGVLSRFLLPGVAEDGYDEVAEELGMKTGAVKVAVFRMRKRFKALLRSEIFHTVTEHTSVEDELHHLYAALASG
jgi:RNA polymerase sigma-70 factor (ECF subfamily)